MIDLDAAYMILAFDCGASESVYDYWQFKMAVQRMYDTPHTPVEYRFGGKLGFGGKFRYSDGRWYVDCYREDETPERLIIIKRANERLAELSSEVKR